MADNKDYISRADEMGNIHISEEVLAVISAAAALEVEGVSSLTGGKDLTELLGRKNMAKGVRITVNGEAVTVELSLLIKYGSSILEVAEKVQEAVGAAVEATSGLNVEAVNVHVCGVSFEKETKTVQQ